MTLTTSYSIISLVFTEDKADKIGLCEATFGFGLMIGPPFGSLVFGMLGYEYTFYVFAAITTLCTILTASVLPNKLNL